ncbi:MAG: RidA family protein [Myxococcales bacterium]|nr:RidA family protein [Myxococcales bacterium]
MHRRELGGRLNVYSGAPWERAVAYCRATRVGPWVLVAGTTAVDDAGEPVAAGDMAGQTAFVLAKIARALAACGASLGDVVRTRAFVTDIDRFGEFAAAHREAFQAIDPVATCVEVQRLVDPALVVEIEVDAYVAED